MGEVMTRVLVVDDHGTVADAVAVAISREDDLECIATTGDADEALRLAGELRPDVVVMDVRLRDADGIDTTSRLLATAPATRVIILTGFVTRGLLERAVAAGACGLMPKDGQLDDLLAAVRSSRRDDFMVHPSLVRLLVGGGAGEQHPPTTPLTSRERDVLARLAAGEDAGGIARGLGISLLTCRGHIKNILSKLGAHTQLEAVVTAHRRGLIQLDDPD